jgi:hypothetical protein
MSIFPNFLRSLVLTIIFSFIAPMLFFGGVILTLSLMGYIPGLEATGETITRQILQFLATFGSGTPLRGIFVISLTCSFVGALFDTYAFYKYQNLRDRS